MDPSTFTMGLPVDWSFEQALREMSYKTSPTRQTQVYRPAHRVSKITSTGNSPKKAAARRSTLSSGYDPSRPSAGALSRKWQSPSTTTEDQKLQVFSRARPISWHPSSHFIHRDASSSEQPSYFVQECVASPSTLQPCTTTEVHGLITPLSQPCYDEPLSQEIFPPLDEPRRYEDPYAFLDEFGGAPEWVISSPYADEPTDRSDNDSHIIHPTPIQQYIMNTAPPSPQSSVTQGGEKPSLLLSNIESATEELVGMGLYDPPLPYAVSVMDSGHAGNLNAGKGLKLEETFEPPPPEQEAEAEAEEEEGGAEDGDHEMAEDVDEGEAKGAKQGGSPGNDSTTREVPSWQGTTVKGWI